METMQPDVLVGRLQSTLIRTCKTVMQDFS